MTYNKKRMLSYGVILISVLLAYFCRLVRPKNTFARNFADQCRNCIYLGLYCAWVIYLEKHVVYKKMRRCLTAIGCLMVFWFFVRTVKFHIFHEPLGEHICWYLYYIPMILIPVLGLSAALFFVEKDEEKTVRQIIILLTVAAVFYTILQHLFCQNKSLRRSPPHLFQKFLLHCHQTPVQNTVFHHLIN